MILDSPAKLEENVAHMNAAQAIAPFVMPEAGETRRLRRARTLAQKALRRAKRRFSPRRKATRALSSTRLSSKRAPGPRASSALRHLRALQHDPIRWFTQMTAQYGDCVRIRLGASDLFLINHPDLVEEVLVKKPRHFSKGRVMRKMRRVIGDGLLTSEGAVHRSQRRLSQPAFHRARVDSYAQMMIKCALKTRAQWELHTEKHDANSLLDVNASMKHLTMAVVGKTMMSVDLEGENADLGATMTDLMDAFNWLVLPGFGLIEQLPLRKSQRFRRARARLNAMIYRLIEERRRDNRDRGDLLSMLMLASDENGAQMSDLQVRDEAMTIFIAGHESQTNALNWVWVLLAQNPAAETKLHDELNRVLDGRAPCANDYANLTYTKMLLQETLRLYAPVWTIGRCATSDVQIGGYRVPKGSPVMMSPYVLGRDARFYENPSVFEPERWRGDAHLSRPKYAYFPFGAGPRLCIGEAFAWMEAVLLVATLAQKFRLKLPDDAPIEPQAVVTVGPKGGLKMLLERRN